MRLRKLAVLLALASPAAFAGAPPPAAAPAASLGPASTAVKTANDNLRKLLAQNAPPAQVTQVVGNFLNINALGKAAMAAHWSKLTPAEQQQFQTTLHDLVLANYVNGAKAQINYTTAYKGEQKLPSGNLLVHTEVTAQRNGRPLTINIDYELDAQLQAIDVLTDGVGLVANYTTMFNTIMNKGGYPMLISKMQTKLGQIQGGTSTAAPAQTMPSTKR